MRIHDLGAPRRLMIAGCFVAAISACGSSEEGSSVEAEPPAAAPPEVEPPSPFGRWFESDEGSSYRFDEGEIVVVAGEAVQRRVRVPGWEPDAVGWYLEGSASSPSFRLRPLPGERYELCEGESCRPLHGASEPARLDAIAAAVSEPSAGSTPASEP